MIGQDMKHGRNDWTKTWLGKKWNTRGKSVTFFFSHSSLHMQPCYTLLFIYSHVAVHGKIAGRWIGDRTISFIYTNWQIKNALKIRILKNPWLLIRSSRSQIFLKISVLKNLGDLTGKHLCWSLFLIKLQACGQIHSNDSSTTAEHHWWLLHYSNVTLAVVTSVS